MSDRWYSSGRGIFRRDGGFQLATMPAQANWEEDTAMFVRLLNRGEEYDDLRTQLAEANARAKDASAGIEDALRYLCRLDSDPAHGIHNVQVCLTAARAALASGGKP